MLHQEISYQDPFLLFAQFANQDATVFLDSAQKNSDCGRYSFIAIDPFFILTSKNGNEGDPFSALAEKLAEFPAEIMPDLPPFQGGVAGFFGYELYQHLENIPLAKKDDMQFPDLAVGFYDLVLAFDHEEKRAFIFSNGYPEKEKNARKIRAEKRLNWILSLLDDAKDSVMPAQAGIHPAISQVSPQQYKLNVEKIKNYILNGDIFQANLSQRFSTELPENFSIFNLYCSLRNLNPAFFSVYLKFSDTIIASASPERFLKLSKKNIETRPIKGTAPRGKNKTEDDFLANQLLASEKDRAENTMIVDLLRNDLSRICENHSVKVLKLCELESYATVHHLVSIVTGTLRKNLTAIDLLRATFPGGSITGAPKIRAMEIIAELEETQRGPYCGSVGYIGFNGEMDLSILIRSFCVKNNVLTFQTGGAVVADSDAEQEYEETLLKARALQEALYDFTHR